MPGNTIQKLKTCKLYNDLTCLGALRTWYFLKSKTHHTSSMKSSVQFLAGLSTNLTHASWSHHRCEDFIRKPSRTSPCYVQCVNMEVAVFLRSEDRICPDIPLPSSCQVTDLLYFFFKTTLSHGICLWKVVVGRGPLTGLKDKRVGRRQLVLTSNQGVVQVGSALHICHSENKSFWW